MRKKINGKLYFIDFGLNFKVFIKNKVTKVTKFAGNTTALCWDILHLTCLWRKFFCSFLYTVMDGAQLPTSRCSSLPAIRFILSPGFKNTRSLPALAARASKYMTSERERSRPTRRLPITWVILHLVSVCGNRLLLNIQVKSLQINLFFSGIIVIVFVCVPFIYRRAPGGRL